MKTGIIGLAVGIITASVGAAVGANEFEGALRNLVDEQIGQIVADPALVAAIQAQNTRHAGMSAQEIEALDLKWRSEVGDASTPTIDPVINGAVADRLRGYLDQGAGLYTEIFVMDNLGLNVAASSTTSDYWQGDEAKWQETFAKGAGAVHISDVELDESTQSYQAQVSVSIVDADGNAIGAATFGVNVEHLN